mmetsp:Transcript_37671/g.120852  ORF Transcript_37671/g.120852 Transcript_37671/m.120852 type:complete len:147 (+) Transcript_37671:72-512(+)
MSALLEGSTATYRPCKVVAEIGCNHMGSLEIAKELMKLAKDTGASYAKFQKRCPKELLTKEQYEKPHPVPHNSYGQTYGAHREFLEFSKDQHMTLWVRESVGRSFLRRVVFFCSLSLLVSRRSRDSLTHRRTGRRLAWSGRRRCGT